METAKTRNGEKLRKMGKEMAKNKLVRNWLQKRGENVKSIETDKKKSENWEKPEKFGENGEKFIIPTKLGKEMTKIILKKRAKKVKYGEF